MHQTKSLKENTNPKHPETHSSVELLKQRTLSMWYCHCKIYQSHNNAGTPVVDFEKGHRSCSTDFAQEKYWRRFGYMIVELKPRRTQWGHFYSNEVWRCCPIGLFSFGEQCSSQMVDKDNWSLSHNLHPLYIQTSHGKLNNDSKTEKSTTKIDLRIDRLVKAKNTKLSGWRKH